MLEPNLPKHGAPDYRTRKDWQTTTPTPPTHLILFSLNMNKPIYYQNEYFFCYIIMH